MAYILGTHGSAFNALGGDNQTADAFGRLRVSNSVVLWDAKFLADTQPLLWDNQETTGAGTLNAGAAYGILAVTKKPTHIGATIDFIETFALLVADTEAKLELCLNPTVAGSPSFSSIPESALMGFQGTATNTVSNKGTVLQTFLISASKNSRSSGISMSSKNTIGSFINGTSDRVWLVLTPFAATNAHTTLNWTEII